MPGHRLLWFYSKIQFVFSNYLSIYHKKVDLAGHISTKEAAILNIWWFEGHMARSIARWEGHEPFKIIFSCIYLAYQIKMMFLDDIVFCGRHFEFSSLKIVAQGCQGGTRRILHIWVPNCNKQQKNRSYTRCYTPPLYLLDYMRGWFVNFCPD